MDFIFGEIMPIIIEKRINIEIKDIQEMIPIKEGSQ